MTREMIMRYDFAPLEHSDQYLQKVAAAGDEEPISSNIDIHAKKGRLNNREPTIYMDTLSYPKS